MSKKYIINRDGKFLEFTEDEVRKLASQLPENSYKEIYDENGNLREGFLKQMIQTLKEDYSGAWEDIISEDDTTHLTASQAVYAGVGPDGEPLDKVSDCCGAEVEEVIKKFKTPDFSKFKSIEAFRKSQKGQLTCKSCGEPCEPQNASLVEDGAVEFKGIKKNGEAIYSKSNEKDFTNNEVEVDCPDTKPDPIESINKTIVTPNGTVTNYKEVPENVELARKQGEIIEVINYLLKHE